MLILVHLGSPKLVGQYGFAVAVSAPVLALTSLQLRGLLATDAKGEYSFGTYLGLRLVGIVVSALVMIVVLTLSDIDRSVSAVTAGLVLRRAVESISDIYYGLFQRYELHNLIAHATIWSTLLNLLVLALILSATGSLAWALAGTAVASVVPLLLHNIPHAGKLVRTRPGGAQNLRPEWDGPLLRQLFVQVVPLTIVSSLLVLHDNVPRYILGAGSNMDQLGIFVALTSLLVAAYIFSNAIALIISPRLAIHVVNNEKREFKRLLLKTELGAFLATVSATGIAVAYGPEFISWIYGPAYAEHDVGVVLLALSAGLSVMGQFVANANTAARRLNVQVPVTVVALITLVLSCLWLIPQHGVEGAIVAITGALLVRLIAHSVVLWRFFRSWSSVPVVNLGD